MIEEEKDDSGMIEEEKANKDEQKVLESVELSLNSVIGLSDCAC